jgi:N-acetylneuraminic acid mutarotase
LPAPIGQAFGGRGLKQNPLICGGTNSVANGCYSFENNGWISAGSLTSARSNAAVVQLQSGQLFVTGGLNGPNYLSSAEILTAQGWQAKVPSLPATFGYHCMVEVNSTTVLLIGGIQNGARSRKTFYLRTQDQSWTAGPELKTARNIHSCGRIKKDNASQGTSIIVVGGFADGFTYLTSVEILDEGSNAWRSGPELPIAVDFSQMVNDPNAGVVLVAGYSPNWGYLTTLWQLPHGGNDAVWKQMVQKLKIPRYRHTAFLVPDSITSCY